MDLNHGPLLSRHIKPSRPNSKKKRKRRDRDAEEVRKGRHRRKE